jgi:hypothetical protein
VDIKVYENRAKFKNLPDDFNHQESIKFESNWEYCKTLSNYHFDKWRVETEGEWFHYLGRYIGDWSKELECIKSESKNLAWSQLSSTAKHPGFKSGSSSTIDQENNDKISHGLENTEYTNMVLNDFLIEFPVFRKMLDYWHLEKPALRAHVQYPGQSFIRHIDKLWHRNPKDPTKIVRFVIHLEDWEPGQMMMYGNAFHGQWKAGDIHIFDTLNVPHCSSNLSDKPRTIIIITGHRTERTDNLLLSASNDSRYVI